MARNNMSNIISVIRDAICSFSYVACTNQKESRGNYKYSLIDLLILNERKIK